MGIGSILTTLITAEERESTYVLFLKNLKCNYLGMIRSWLNRQNLFENRFRTVVENVQN